MNRHGSNYVSGIDSKQFVASAQAAHYVNTRSVAIVLPFDIQAPSSSPRSTSSTCYSSY